MLTDDTLPGSRSRVSATHAHQAAVERYRDRLTSAKTAILAVIESAEEEHLRASAVVQTAAATTGLPFALVQTAALMLESNGSIRWNTALGHYELGTT